MTTVVQDKNTDKSTEADISLPLTPVKIQREAGSVSAISDSSSALSDVDSSEAETDRMDMYDVERSELRELAEENKKRKASEEADDISKEQERAEKRPRVDEEKIIDEPPLKEKKEEKEEGEQREDRTEKLTETKDKNTVEVKSDYQQQKQPSEPEEENSEEQREVPSSRDNNNNSLTTIETVGTVDTDGTLITHNDKEPTTASTDILDANHVKGDDDKAEEQEQQQQQQESQQDQNDEHKLESENNDEPKNEYESHDDEDLGEEEDLEEEEEEDDENDKPNWNDDAQSIEQEEQEESETVDAEAIQQEALRDQALSSLNELEMDFAKLKDMIYGNQMTKLQYELELCLKGSHPEFVNIVDKINRNFDAKLNRLIMTQKYQLQCIDNQTKATRLQLHQQYMKDAQDLKLRSISRTTSKWYEINKERRHLDNVILGVPDYYQFNPDLASAAKKNQTALVHELANQRRNFQQELGVLTALQQNYRFPSSLNHLTAAREDEIESDLLRMKK
ncbi:hypothetical protein LJB42_001896 [Komagataella kurtzmanii]|nr:hypothetical protein LJB42_001896 [Komagataella kurtzmanii]